MRIVAVRKVNKDEAMRYLLPALKELSRLNIPYEVKDKEIVIKIPTLLPVKK